MSTRDIDHDLEPYQEQYEDVLEARERAIQRHDKLRHARTTLDLEIESAGKDVSALTAAARRLGELVTR